MIRNYEINSRGHNWIRNDYDGEVDIFAYTAGEYHNGPKCSACGYGFCHHCEDGPDCDCDAIIDVVAKDTYVQLVSGEK